MAAVRTGLAGATMDQEAVLEGAAGAVDVAEVVDRGSLCVDSRLERVLDRVAEPRELGAREPAHGPQRVDFGQEQRLVGIDVAHARDASLIQEPRLDRSGPPPRGPTQILRGELRREWLDRDPGLEISVSGLCAEQQMPRAEPSWVRVHEPMTIVELEPDPRVPRFADRIEQERPGHPQMHQQVPLV
jgi:hypothetical protein